MNTLPINRDSHPMTGDLLVPKRGRHLDPVIVIHRMPGDKVAVVKDQSLVERDPAWQGNRVLSTSEDDGALWLTYRELGRNYRIDADNRAKLEAKIARTWRAKGVAWKAAAA